MRLTIHPQPALRLGTHGTIPSLLPLVGWCVYTKNSPTCKARSSGLLRKEEWWFLTDVSEQIIGSIFKGQDSYLLVELRHAVVHALLETDKTTYSICLTELLSLIWDEQYKWTWQSETYCSEEHDGLVTQFEWVILECRKEKCSE